MEGFKHSAPTVGERRSRERFRKGWGGRWQVELEVAEIKKKQKMLSFSQGATRMDRIGRENIRSGRQRVSDVAKKKKKKPERPERDGLDVYSGVTGKR